MKPIIQGVIATLVSVCGCELTTELGTYPTADHDSTETQIDGSESASDLEGESGETESSEGGPTETSGGDGGDGDGDGDGDPNEGVCAIDGSEDPCRICLEHLCCAQLESCDTELGCFCMLDCLTEFDPVTCAMTCTPALAYFLLLQCQAMSCTAVCE